MSPRLSIACISPKGTRTAVMSRIVMPDWRRRSRMKTSCVEPGQMPTRLPRRPAMSRDARPGLGHHAHAAVAEGADHHDGLARRGAERAGGDAEAAEIDAAGHHGVLAVGRAVEGDDLDASGRRARSAGRNAAASNGSGAASPSSRCARPARWRHAARPAGMAAAASRWRRRIMVVLLQAGVGGGDRGEEAAPAAEAGDVLGAGQALGFHQEALGGGAVVEQQRADAQRRGNAGDEAAEAVIGQAPDLGGDGMRPRAPATRSRPGRRGGPPASANSR